MVASPGWLWPRGPRGGRVVDVVGRNALPAVQPTAYSLKPVVCTDWPAPTEHATTPPPPHLTPPHSDAARLRATVGEISDALRDIWGSHVPSNTVVQGAYSATFNAAASDAEVEYKELQTKINQVQLNLTVYEG